MSTLRHASTPLSPLQLATSDRVTRILSTYHQVIGPYAANVILPPLNAHKIDRLQSCFRVLLYADCGTRPAMGDRSTALNYNDALYYTTNYDVNQGGNGVYDNRPGSAPTPTLRSILNQLAGRPDSPPDPPQIQAQRRVRGFSCRHNCFRRQERRLFEQSARVALQIIRETTRLVCWKSVGER